MKKTRKILKSNEIKATMYLFPALLIIGIFQIYPIFKALAMSFYTKFDYISGKVYEVGFDNFEYVLNDSDFYLALRNTSIFVFFAVPLSIALALLFALILNSDIRFKSLFRSIYFIPFVTSMVAVSIVWKWMLNKEFGLINSILMTFGMSKVGWLTDPHMTIPILVVISVWKGLGYKIIIFLAGLQCIDDKYYLAAKIDGATKLQRFKHITLPLLKPILIFLFITSAIGAFKTFDEVFIIYDQKAGPLKSGLTIVYYIFIKFYRHWQFSISAAAAFMLFVIILMFTIIQFRLTDKEKIRRTKIKNIIRMTNKKLNFKGDMSSYSRKKAKDLEEGNINYEKKD